MVGRKFLTERMPFLLILFSVAVLSACSETSAKLSGPTSIVGLPNIVQAATTVGKQGLESPGNWFDDAQLGHVKKTNLTGESAHYQVVLMDRTDPANQKLAGWSQEPLVIASTREADLFAGLKLPVCDNTPFQVDIVKNVPFYITKGTTWAELQNYFDGGDSRVRNQYGAKWTAGALPGCDVEPPPPPPPPPSCEVLKTCPPPPPPQCVVTGAPLTNFVTPILAQNSPLYPESTPVLPFDAPAGFLLRITLVTEDDHSKLDEYPTIPTAVPQGEEQGTVLWASGVNTYEGASDPSEDVPDIGSPHDTRVTVSYRTFDHRITHVQVIHAGPFSAVPNRNSFRLVSLTVECADGAQAQQVRR